jgi:hypothetical protein
MTRLAPSSPPSSSPYPALADPAQPPGLAPLSAEATLPAIARIRPADRSTGGCTAVLIAPDVALTAAHCARGAVSGPAAMRLTFRPDSAPFAVTVRAVAFHADAATDPLSFDNAHADIALLRLAQPVPARHRHAHPAGHRAAGRGPRRALRLPQRPGEALHGHPHCASPPSSPTFWSATAPSSRAFPARRFCRAAPATGASKGIAVAQVFGQPYRALIADVVPWPDFAGPYALPAPPSAPPSAPAETSP